MPKNKILFVAREATPFIATGGLAEVIGSLSLALAKDMRNDVRVVLPLYSKMSSEYREKLKYLGYIYVDLAWRHEYCGIYSYEQENVVFYFLDSEKYFKRPSCYGFSDDGERFAFFSKASLDLLEFLDFYPDILHAHDWQSALSIVYLKTNYFLKAKYKDIKTLFTIHNIEYQGRFNMSMLCDTFDIYEIYRGLLEYDGCINLMKAAIECSDRFSTVSPKYASEIRFAYFAHGLDHIIQANVHKLTGILNGINDISYNATLDTHLFKNFSVDDLSGKKVCKKELQKLLGLPVKENTPIISMISRLVSHKGIDLVICVLESLLQNDVQVVILGTGEKEYEDFFKRIENKYPDRLCVRLEFNNDLSRKIYSGSDIFLMPSKSEPCGLSQMIASRYATVPIVRETGGLYDSIQPEVNGYTFTNFNAHDMLYVVEQAIFDYHNSSKWEEMQKRVMNKDFSWNKSAIEYMNLYKVILNK